MCRVGVRRVGVRRVGVRRVRVRRVGVRRVGLAALSYIDLKKYCCFDALLYLRDP